MTVDYHRKIAPVKWTVVNLLLTLRLLTLIVSLSFVTSTQAADRTYGPVKQNDFLSKIVNRSYGNSSLSKDQIMVAILRSNPESFKGGNIHYLRQAVTLVLPNDDEIASIPAKEASALIAEHLVFFKRGVTGKLVNKPLALSTAGNSTTGTSASGKDAEPVKDSPAHEKATAELPSKIRIEVRKEKQEKENNYKHVIALERISNQQNNALRTLDEHIRLLEDQLQVDSQEDKAKVPPVKSSDDVLDEKTESSEVAKHAEVAGSDDAYAESAISSLEKKLSETENSNDDENKGGVVANERDTERGGIQTTPVAPDINDALAFENTNSTIQQPMGQDSTSSLVSTLKSMDKSKIFALMGAFVLGLFAFSYFFFGRNSQQKSTVVTTPLRKEKFTETVGSPLQIPDAESLLNPVIRTKASDTSINENRPSSVANAGEFEEGADSDTQEAELKINMARAYMDMSYIDASKEILNEVIRDGSKEQKETAQQMLSML